MQMLGKAHHVPGRRLVAGIGKPRGIGKGAAAHAKFARPRRHALGKGGIRARHAFGDDNAAIIGVLDDDAGQEIIDADGGFQRREHGRGARRRTARAPGIFRDGISGLRRHLTLGQRIQHHLHRHQLGERCRWKRLILILRKKHRSRFGIDHIGLFGLGDEGGCL
ncbi:hypothetical protein D3C71_482850 [compost metagenome]